MLDDTATRDDQAADRAIFYAPRGGIRPSDAEGADNRLSRRTREGIRPRHPHRFRAHGSD
jgi:hypothetical protein